VGALRRGGHRRAGGDDEREATCLRNLATVVWRHQGQRDEAHELAQRARALYDKSHGAHYEFELTLADEVLAGISFDMARPEEALALYRKTAEVRERLFGGDHPSLATSYVNEGESLTVLGRPDEAIPLLERAIAIDAASHARGGGGYYRHRLAAALRAKGAAEAALAEDQKAHAAAAASGETGQYWESWSLTGIGLDLLLLGRAKEAVDPLERAVKERASGGALPFEIAESRFALARALWATGETGRARTLAVEAKDALAEDAQRYGSWYAGAKSEIERWLAEHPRA
jgi:tetratricopeptide (TPR) repeat protein